MKKLIILIVTITICGGCSKNRNIAEDGANISILELKKYILKDVKINGKKIDLTSTDRKIANIKKYGAKKAMEIEHKKAARARNKVFNMNQKKEYISKNLDECIKPNNVVDAEVNLCLKGRIKKTW